MPKLDPKTIQRELEQGILWPVYWIHGEERMKARELLKRIRTTVGGDGTGAFGQTEEMLDGNECNAQTIIDSVQSPMLGGGLKLVVVRDAHAIKKPEELETVMGPKAKKDELAKLAKLGGVLVLISKDLDGRKKFSKTLIERSAVVACEEVPEEERDAWIAYLAKRRGMALQPATVAHLRALDPWTLDIVDQELEKYFLADMKDEVLIGGAALAAYGGGESFLESFFQKNLTEALAKAESFANQPDEALPLLGLLGWNVRQVALLMKGNLKLSPFLVDRLKRWSARWNLDEILRLQSRLAEVDYALKQTPLLPLGLWADIVIEFCSQLKKPE